ncbi:MAG: response regulator [Chlorobiota bacterium]
MEAPFRLLVVDDDRLSRYLWRRIAEEVGLEVLEAGTPERARKLLEHFVPDVIVLDVVFPDEDGVSFLHELRQSERWCQTPVIICSGVGEQGVVLELARQGICTYLLKPFAVEEARERLRTILRRRGLVVGPSEGESESEGGSHSEAERGADSPTSEP